MPPKETGGDQQQEQRPQVQEFRFIDSSGRARGPRRGRRDVRSFVMQNARRQRPWSTSKHKTTPATQVEKGNANANTGIQDTASSKACGKNVAPSVNIGEGSRSVRRKAGAPAVEQRLEEESLCLVCKVSPSKHCNNFCGRCYSVLSLKETNEDTLKAGQLDAFNILPVKTNAEVSRLLEYFLVSVLPVWIPIDARRSSTILSTGWFGHALTNAASMHSMLCSAALHLFILGQGSYDMISYHKHQAVAAVNTNLADPKVSLGDANIAAVFTILTIEESLMLPVFKPYALQGQADSHEQRKIHLSGLKRMLQLRGGLRALNSNKCLQALIVWHVTSHFIASFGQPYTNLTDATGIPARYNIPTPLDLDPSAYHMLEVCHTLPLSRDILELISDVCRYAVDLRYWYLQFLHVEALDLQTQGTLLSYRLIHYVTTWEGAISAIEQTLCLCMLVFVVKCSDPIDQSFDLLHLTAIKKLSAAVTALGQQAWDMAPELLMWIHAIAAISARGACEEAMFVRLAGSARRLLKVDGYEQFMGYLRRCLWVDARLEGGSEWLWHEMMRLPR